MGNTTFLNIPVVKGDLTIPVNNNDGVRVLLANAVTKTFNKSYITNITDMVSPQTGATLCWFDYEAPGSASKRYEANLTRAALIVLDV